MSSFGDALEGMGFKPQPIKPLKSSRDIRTGFSIERPDLNKAFSDVANTFSPPKPGEPPAILRAAEAAGKAPGFAYERPIAIANTLAQKVTGGKQGPVEDIANFLGGVPILGPVLTGINEVYGEAQSFQSSNGNYALARKLRENRDAPGSKLVTLENRLVTLDEVRKEAAGRGFTDQDLQDLYSGKRGDFSFGDKALASDPMMDMGRRMYTDPLNLIFGIGAAKTGIQAAVHLPEIIAKLFGTGAIVQKALPVADAAVAVAAGSAKEATFLGIAHYAGTAWSGYKKVALASTVGNVALLGAAQTPLGGPLKGLFDLNQEVFDNRPLSDTSLFSLWAAFHVHPAGAIKSGVGTAKYSKFIWGGSDIQTKMVERLSVGWVAKGASYEIKRAAVLERIGGERSLQDFAFHLLGSRAFRLVRPVLIDDTAHFDSLTQSVLQNANLRTAIEAKVIGALERGQIGGKDVISEMEKNFAIRKAGDKVLNETEFPWHGGDAIDQWVAFREASTPLSEVYNKHLLDAVGKEDVALPTVGLTGRVSADDLRTIKIVLHASGDGSTVSAGVLRSWISRFPQLAALDPYFNTILSRAGETVPLVEVNRHLNAMIKKAPTIRQLTQELGAREAKGAGTLVEEPRAFDPNWTPEDGGAQIGISRWRAGKEGFGTQATVEEAMASRNHPAIALADANTLGVLQDSGFNAQRVNRIVGTWEGLREPSLEVVMRGARLPELRIAAARLVKTFKQDTGIISISGKSLESSGLKANGVEVVYQFPATDSAVLQRAMEVVDQAFPGSSLNAETGILKIAQHADWFDNDIKGLVARIDKLEAELNNVFPKDLVNETGLRKTMTKAYVEVIASKKGLGSDLIASDILRESRTDARSRAYAANESRLAGAGSAVVGERVGGPVGTGAGYGRSDGVGSGAPGLAREELSKALTDTGALRAEEVAPVASVMDALFRTLAREEGVSTASWYRTHLAGIVRGGDANASALKQIAQFERDTAKAADVATTLDNAQPPQVLIDNGLDMGSPLEWVDAANGTKLGIPGGLEGLNEGTFTIWDELRLRAQAINPKDIPDEIRLPLYKKIWRSKTIDFTDPVEIYNRAAFSIMSPQTNLSFTEALYGRVRATSLEDLQAIAAFVKDLRAQGITKPNAIGFKLQQKWGAYHGEVKNPEFPSIRSQTSNVQWGNAALFAERVAERPEWFVIREGEDLSQYADRLMNVMPGAQMKVGTLTVELGDPMRLNRGTMDSQMVKTITLWARSKGPAKYQELLDRLTPGQKGGKSAFRKMIEADKWKDAPAGKETYRLKNGEYNTNVPEYLKGVYDDLPAEWLPKQLHYYGKDYEVFDNYLAEMQAEAALAQPEIAELGRAAFQWYNWDPTRGKLEPHYLLNNGGVHKLPEQSIHDLTPTMETLRVGGFTLDKPLASGNATAFDPRLGFLYQKSEAATQAELHMRAANKRYAAGDTAGGDILAAKAKNIRDVEARLASERSAAGVDYAGNAGGAVYQRGDVIKGSTELLDGSRAMIRFYEAADASTAIHEGYHAARLLSTGELRAQIDAAYGVVDGKWTAAQEELFARHGERFVRSGVAPIPELQNAFMALADLLRNIYRTLKGSPLEKRLTPSQRALHERLLSTADDRAGIDAIGLGDVASAKAEAGFLYRTTSMEDLVALKGGRMDPKHPTEGLEWPQSAPGDVSNGKRLYFSKDPQTLVGSGQVLVRVRQDVAGKVRHDFPDKASDAYTVRGVRSSLTEVYGADGLWHPVDDFLTPPLGEVPAELAEAHAAVAGEYADVPNAYRPDNTTMALRAENDLSNAERFGGPDPQLMAAMDARVMRELDVPVRNYDPSVADQSPAYQSIMARFEDFLATDAPQYTTKVSPEVAWLYRPTLSGPVINGLREQNALQRWMTVTNPITHWADWALTEVSNSTLSKAAVQHLHGALIPYGATPRQIENFRRSLARAVEEGPHAKGAPLIRGTTGLSSSVINRIGKETFAKNKKLLEAMGDSGFSYAIDRAANRFVRSSDAKIKAGDAGFLTELVNKTYTKYQESGAGHVGRYVSKVFYPWFRFYTDPRWWAMNVFEADMLGWLRYGKSRYNGVDLKATELTGSASMHAEQAGLGKAALRAEMDTGSNTGWMWNRQYTGHMNAAWDVARPESTLQAVKDFPLSMEKVGSILGVKGEQNIVAALEKHLYEIDTKGLGKAMEDTITADQSLFAGGVKRAELQPLFDKVWERNQQAFEDLSNAFHGNPNRTHLERTLNNYWLFWPLSYQLKASRWMYDILTKGVAGRRTGLAGANMYAHYADIHKKKMVDDPEYAAIFDKNPTLWMFASMMFPITPTDIGVSLSRPTRYGVNVALNLIDPNRTTNGSPLGFWGDYQAASDPINFATKVAELGPLYTVGLLKQVRREKFYKDTFSSTSSNAGVGNFPTYPTSN